MSTTLYTIGYENAALEQVIDTLKAARVAQVLDVREAPWSRKPGFSKGMLAASLAEAGIGYVHLRPLGTPKPGRVAARAGDIAGMERMFRVHLAGEEAQVALVQALALAAESPSCLLCYERDPARCHRAIVAEAMAARAEIEVVDLLVAPH